MKFMIAERIENSPRVGRAARLPQSIQNLRIFGALPLSVMEGQASACPMISRTGKDVSGSLRLPSRTNGGLSLQWRNLDSVFNQICAHLRPSVVKVSAAFCLFSMFCGYLSAKPAAVDYDSRRLALDRTLTHEFALENKSSKPVNVQLIQSSRECLKVVTQPEGIKAGGKASVKLLYQPKKIGRADLKVMTSFSDGSRHEFTLTGKVFDGVQQSAWKDFFIDPKLVMEDVKKDASSVAIIDICEPAAFSKAHITGAINAPQYGVESMDYLKSRKIILVDEGISSDVTFREIEGLQIMKFASVRLMQVGVLTWTMSGGAILGENVVGADLAMISPASLTNGGLSEQDAVVIRLLNKKAPAPAPMAGIKTIDVTVSEDVLKTVQGIATAVGKVKLGNPVIVASADGALYDRIEMSQVLKGVPVYYVQGGYGKVAEMSAMSLAMGQRRRVTITDNSTVKQGIHKTGSRSSGGCSSCP